MSLEDREMILRSITDVARFNSDLQWTIFGTEGIGIRQRDVTLISTSESLYLPFLIVKRTDIAIVILFGGLLSKWVDGPGRAAMVGRIVRRAGTFGGARSCALLKIKSFKVIFRQNGILCMFA